VAAAELPKGQKLFKVSEVCKLTNVQPYQLRFWGIEFPQLKLQKNGAGQQCYNRSQVETILEIRRLLQEEQLTIAGARRRIEAMGVAGEGAAKAVKTSSGRRKSTQEPAEVDKTASASVKPLLAALRDVREEVSQLLEELKTK